MVLDASALVDILAVTGRAAGVRDRIHSAQLHAPAHLDAQVLAALGRLSGADQLSLATVELTATPGGVVVTTDQPLAGATPLAEALGP